jgi:hypothetical protein
MAKKLTLKCLGDADLEKDDLAAEHKGKIGVFDGGELVGMAEAIDGWKPKDEKDGKKLAELFAAGIGLPGKSLVEIAAAVKLGQEAPLDHFAALSEAISEGRLDLRKAGPLADAGRLSFSAILLAQEAEAKVDEAIGAGKVKPENRGHALKLGLSDAAGFKALIEDSTRVGEPGEKGGGETRTARVDLMTEVNAYAADNKCSIAVALSEVTKRNPELWRSYSAEAVSTLAPDDGVRRG